MKALTATEVSKMLGISTRMLRYYEKEGLIKTVRKEDYAYRCYDEADVRRLHQILVLRKLRIPLKQISVILSDDDQQSVYEIMKTRLSEVDNEISALETVRSVLQAFVSRLDEGIRNRTQAKLLDDATVMEIVNTLVLPKTTLRETQMDVRDLDKAQEVLRGDLRVRIVVLPSMTVAAYHFIGENAEEIACDVVSRFVRELGLYEIKPDSRMFGFNHPEPAPDRPYGFEVYVTIPDDLEINAPLVKKRMQGGIYAGITIDYPNFHEWELIMKWLDGNNKWEKNYAPEGDEIMCGCYEEHLNWVYSSHHGFSEDDLNEKIDLLLPIKRKEHN